MARVFLGLGSNLGDRKAILETAVSELKSLSSGGTLRVSSTYETPALLPPLAPPSWNKPFLNIVVGLEIADDPILFLTKLKSIEKDLGRIDSERWAPRALDIDILFWENVEIQSEQLSIPHPSLRERAFVLDPLAEMSAELKFGKDTLNVRQCARQHPKHCPRLMGIVNLTPDSFSDGGNYLRLEHLENTLDEWDKINVAFIDLGAESTRPKAQPISPDEEWSRLEPALYLLRSRFKNKIFKPKISVDTRYSQTAARAIECGVDIINDVSGLSDPQMINVLASSSVQVVLMHSLSVPADPTVTLEKEVSAIEQVGEWFKQKIEFLEKNGIEIERLILDPGIGFGKNSIQSLELLRSLDWIQEFNLPVLIGHSRKSFFSDFTHLAPSDRDIETVAVSLGLVAKGVDILRVHDPIVHHRALLAWRHVQK